MATRKITVRFAGLLMAIFMDDHHQWPTLEIWFAVLALRRVTRSVRPGLADSFHHIARGTAALVVYDLYIVANAIF